MILGVIVTFCIPIGNLLMAIITLLIQIGAWLGWEILGFILVSLIFVTIPVILDRFFPCIFEIDWLNDITFLLVPNFLIYGLTIAEVLN